MDWLGIGVLIIGIALFILVLILIKPLVKLASVLSSLQQTTDRIPKILDENAKEAHTALQNVNKTLENVNEQIGAVHPFFKIIEDVGLASRQVTTKWFQKATALKETTAEAEVIAEDKKYAGLYGMLSFVFYLSQNKEALSNASKALKK